MMARVVSYMPVYAEGTVVTRTTVWCECSYRFAQLLEALAAAKQMARSNDCYLIDAVATNDPPNMTWVESGAVAIHVGP